MEAERPACVVSLLTDYGLDDGFVGVLHSVIRSRVPGVPIVDLAHGIPAQDIRAGSLALRRAAPYLAPGICVAVVDPGVGTARRAVAVVTPAVIFLGPDNGLLIPAVDVLGGGASVIELEDHGYWLPAPGPTFAGRDIFAPAAAHLAAGGDVAGLGRPTDLASLARLPLPVNRRWDDGSLETEVTWVDRYGNVQLAAVPDEVGTSDGHRLGVTVWRPGAPPNGPGVTGPAPPGEWGRAGRLWPARRVTTYADLQSGELGLLVDSNGCLALCLNGASAASLVDARAADLVRLRWSGTASAEGA
jgi:hypothetical protein